MKYKQGYVGRKIFVAAPLTFKKEKRSNSFMAVSLEGVYTIKRRCGEKDSFVYSFIDGRIQDEKDTKKVEFSTFEKCVSACQKDYEKRLAKNKFFSTMTCYE